MERSGHDLVAALRRVADDAGCAALGVAAADPYPVVASELEDRVANGMSGKLGFTFKDPRLATDVRRSLPWANRLVVLSWSYLPAAGEPGPGRVGWGRVARFATEDHYRGLRAAADRIARLLHDRGHRAVALIDDDRLVDRAAAVRAGLGWWGKSTMVLDPSNGPWLLLGSVVTDALLPTTPPMKRDCGTCDACIPACPTGAIVAPGVLDASRCLAHWAQVPGVIPRPLRRAMGDRVYGCDDCLDACPPGFKKQRGVTRERGRVDLVRLLGSDDAALLERHRHFYIPRRDPRFLRRNAIVALGNTLVAARSGGEGIAVLAGYLGHPDWLLRLHAAWALGAIGAVAPSAGVGALLAHQSRREQRVEVVEEIELALAPLEPA
jgi:epoxyqueuosine reductase